MRAFGSAAIVAISLLAPSSGRSANEYRDNPSIVVDRSVETQFLPIGELVSDRVVSQTIGRDANAKIISSNLVGTAFLVSPCYILSAAHVLFGQNEQPKPGVDYTMNFFVGVGSHNGFSGSLKAVPDLTLTSYDAKTDWTILKLPDKKCIGILPQVGYFEVSGKRLASGDQALALGYGNLSNASGGALMRSSGKIISFDQNGIFQFTGSFVTGSSGGPVLILENGTVKVIGLVTSERDIKGVQVYPTYTTKTANNIQSAYDILNNPAVKATLDADKARFGNVNPATERLKRPLPGMQTGSH